MGQAPTAKTPNQLKNSLFILPLWNTANERLGQCVACKVAHCPRAFSKNFTQHKNTDIPGKKIKTRCKHTMNPNARHFETELQAQAETTARRTANVHSEANVVAATAL